MINFNDITSRVRISDILTDCGIKADRKRIPCPIHKGNNPTAFSFNDSTFNCFSCGASGGLLDLTEMLKGCNRNEALKHLAEMAGITLEDYEPTDDPDEAKKQWLRLVINGLVRAIKTDWELLDMEGRLAMIDLMEWHLANRFHWLRRRFRDSEIGIAQFYAEEQYLNYSADYWLSRHIKLKSMIKMRKKHGGGYGIHTSRKN